MIEFPVRNGFRLCSQKDPWAEARRWVEQLPASTNSYLLILGLGAGFHVRELVRSRPELKFRVYDFDCLIDPPAEWRDRVQILKPDFSVLDIFAQAMGEELLNFRIVDFRPAWAGMESNFLDLRLKLKGAKDFQSQVIPGASELNSKLKLALQEVFQ